MYSAYFQKMQDVLTSKKATMQGFA